VYLKTSNFAGVFYPSEPKELSLLINKFLLQAKIKISRFPKALIVPHAGYDFSGLVAAYGFKSIQSHSEIKKAILLGPSHNFSFSNFCSLPKGFWETPLGKVEILSKDDFPAIKTSSLFWKSKEIFEPEHCLEVEIPFLQSILKDFKIFPLLTGEIDSFEAAEVLTAIFDRETILIVSSDLSHYLRYDQANNLDKKTLSAILKKDIKKLETGEACGKKAIEIVLTIAKKMGWRAELLKYLNSGDTAGDKERVVGYASVVFS